jgi:uncharacterized protein (DUF433 family)
MSTGGQTRDVRYEPAYQLSEAARYIHVPKQTVWNWFRGLNDKPVLDLASSDHQTYVSFMGLAEAHVLSSMRTKHGVPLQRIRRALDHLKRRFNSEHPLVEFEFQTDGLDLFVEEIGSLTNVSRYGQTGMRDVLKLYLSRIDRGDDGLPVRLYPFTQNKIESDPRIIVIDPSVSFGRPMIRRTGITTSAVAERFKSGESIASLADDFNREPAEIEAAIRSELDLQPAA